MNTINNQSFNIINTGGGSLTITSISISGSPVSSGIYYYRMKAGTYLKTRRMILLK